jgi:hypothetical protein
MIFICNSLNGELGTNRRFIAGSYSKIKLDWSHFEIIRAEPNLKSQCKGRYLQKCKKMPNHCTLMCMHATCRYADVPDSRRPHRKIWLVMVWVGGGGTGRRWDPEGIPCSQFQIQIS